MAAGFRLQEQRRVGLITIDTFRIAAVDQLKTYADIMNLQLEVASTPKKCGPHWQPCPIANSC